mmetsp:Transcript_8545/g.12909  ORF Transcript_8545/g.12909 Transcript_8545/m.12909 type:complete len:660 (+) Transcript_8545:118-2097(+)
MTAKLLYRVLSGRTAVLYSPPSRRHKTSSSSINNALRSFSTATPSADHNDDDNNTKENGRLRVAIVGGGAAGMTTALHLSPLVAAGLIQGPIDVYEANNVKTSNKSRTSGHTISGTTTEGGKQLYSGSGALGRHIGVGIWSTAWWPFLRSLEKGYNDANKNRQSYKTLLKDLEACGSYVKDVGYRSPNGSWLVKSQLNASPYGIDDLLHGTTESNGSKSIDNDDPALLFVREKDLLSCLRNAIKIEQKMGTVKYNYGVKVESINAVNGNMGSLELHPTNGTDSTTTTTSPQYHLIIAADGLRSSLRSRYAGHQSIHATSLGIESSSQDDIENSLENHWEHTRGHREATKVENREYIVFRGNAPKLTAAAAGEDGSDSFQTWGCSKSMRFAAVPFRHADEDLEDDDEESNSGHYSQTDAFKERQKDEEVWFATINDPVFIDAYKNSNSTMDAEERKKLLIDAFGSWHNPVKTLIETTPAEDIMYEMALAHKHNASPVFDIKTIMDFERWKLNRKNKGNSCKVTPIIGPGPGPILVFIGDSMMTIDPVLAQGFTMAMESGASIARSIERALSNSPAYSPALLRHELGERQVRRERRLLHLLRSTELVQRLAQPNGFAIFARYFVRPLMKLCPDGIKQGVFNFMIRYSLGLTGGERDSGGKQ